MMLDSKNHTVNETQLRQFIKVVGLTLCIPNDHFQGECAGVACSKASRPS